MKLRCGFVSNSSTSSFSIFGVETSWQELTKVFFPNFEAEAAKLVPVCSHEFNRLSMQFCPSCGSPAFRKTSEKTTADYEDVESELNKLGFDIYNETDCGEGVYVGNNLAGRGGKRGALKRLDELKEVNEKIMSIFGRDADFFSGEYAS